MTLTRHRTIPLGLLLVALAAHPFAALAQEGRERPMPVTHEFQVILVNATPGGLSFPDLPDDAITALEDIVRVLPYQLFELIDTAWIRTHEGARARLGEAAAFEVNLGIDQHSTDERIVISYFELSYRPWERHSDPDVDRIMYGDSENLLGTSFSLNVGETVVVGTSRINGDDEALIVLLKAVK